MNLNRKVDARPLCPEELRLFASPHNAWEHFVKHVLNAGEGEAWSWSVLVPALRAALDAGQRASLFDAARQATVARVPPGVECIWCDFLRLVAEGVEKGVKLAWYWSEEPRPGDGPYRVLAPSGLFACLDPERVRTGFLPFRGEVPAARTERLRRYRLFEKCWQKAQRQYQQATLTEAPPQALQDLMRDGPDPATWKD